MAKYYYDKTKNLKEAIFYVLSGLFMLILRSNSIKLLMCLIGLLFIANGIYTIVKNDNKIIGIIYISFGGVVLICGWIFAEIVLIVLGIAFIIKGALKMRESLPYKNTVAFITSIASMIAGILIIFCRFFLLDLLFIILGIILITDGVFILLEKK